MRLAVCFACLASSVALAAEHKDYSNCKDSPIISRFPGAYINNCGHKNFDAVDVPAPGKWKHVEGEIDQTSYLVPKGLTTLEVQRNLSNALKAAGYEILMDSAGGRLSAHKGNIWYWASVGSAGDYIQRVIREKEMQQQVVANAEELKKGIEANGHMVANGIFFDTDKADLKPESKAALDEIAKLLKQDAALKIYVVGHTDNQGGLAHNMELSKARASSVVKALETQYGLAAARLTPAGDGPTAPVMTNETEDGRAMNRRVELVKQ